MYESAIAAVVIYYSLLFLIRPHPGLRLRSETRPALLPQAPASTQKAAPSSELPESKPATAAIDRDLRAEPTAHLEQGEQAKQKIVSPSAGGLAERLRLGLAKTRSQLFGSIELLFAGRDAAVQREEVLESLFEVLIRSDVGVTTTERLVAAVRARIHGQALGNLAVMKHALGEEILGLFEKVQPAGSGSGQHAQRNRLAELLDPAAVLSAPDESDPLVVMIVGVNGVGKTTTTGKLAKRLRDHGHPVVLGAADTFRAAAVEQLKIWADRAQAEFVTFSDGSDPASVAFETVKRGVELQAKQRASGGPRAVCLVDTAGRLHNRKDLMEELAKVKRVMAKNCQAAPHEVLLVVDATTGQNAIQQAKIFGEAVTVNGLVLTKLDGTAKGGVALAVAGDLGLPIHFVGVGEALDDLQAFEPRQFTAALLGEDLATI